MRLLRNLIPDLSPLRGNRDLQRLTLGNFLTGLGTQAALVALPYQIYVLTGSAFLTGLLGAAELDPARGHVAARRRAGRPLRPAQAAGAGADRADRRAGGLAVGAFLGDPPLPVIYVLAGLLAGLGAMENAAAHVDRPEPRRRPTGCARRWR